MNGDRDMELRFPGLVGSGYQVTSPFDPSYNCIAWAAGDNSKWWEPDPMETCYWPDAAPRDYRLPSYRAVFASLGFTVTENDEFSEHEDRVALFAKGDTPTHAARQLSAQSWTSKLGKNVDISHPLESLCGDLYGDVTLLMVRHTAASHETVNLGQ